MYTLTYLLSRKVSYFDDDGVWTVYSYDKAYVRQYALDDGARNLFDATMQLGTKDFLGGYPGDTGEYWFCVYVKPGSGHYRVFRLAEAIENMVLRYQNTN